MGKVILLSGVGLLAIAAAAIFVARSNFSARLDRMEVVLTAAPDRLTARADLPPEVLALASRLGADAGALKPVARMQQTGEMWQAPGGKPMAFLATQTNAASRNGFLWRAGFSPLEAMQVADYCVGGKGGLEGKLLGIATMVNQSGTPEMLRGELLRYLAELPWNPDAILLNTHLTWTVVGDRRLKVSTREGDVAAEVTLTLDDKGLIIEAGTDARPRAEGGKTVERPWHGRFWDYRAVSGRMVPHKGEVAWVIDGKDFVYWRGMITDWSAGS